jgi:hypothetical protein
MTNSRRRQRAVFKSITFSLSHKLYSHKKASYYRTTKKDSIVRFRKKVSARETFSKLDYDRTSDPDAAFFGLTPTISEQMIEEMNVFKCKEIRVHESSGENMSSLLHFFLKIK